MATARASAPDPHAIRCRRRGVPSPTRATWIACRARIYGRSRRGQSKAPARADGRRRGCVMPTVEQNLRQWDAQYDWKSGGDEWSSAWGNAEAQWQGAIFPRVEAFLPANTILEL